MEKYDLIVIGGGPAGYKAAEKAAKRFKVVLFEKEQPGGVCLNKGCVPTKSLIHAAKELYSCRKHVGLSDVPVSAEEAAKMKAAKEKHVKILRAGVVQSLKKAGVTIVNGSAEISGKRGGLFTVVSDSAEAAAERLLIATGSSPAFPPVKGLKEGLRRGNAVDSTGALDVSSVPSAFAVVGGGVIGVETASLYAMLGYEVSLFEAENELTASPDADSRALMKKTLERLGVRVFTGAKVTEISEDGLSFTLGGEEKKAAAEKILVCTGRRPNLEGYGLENLSPETDRGIVCDEYMRTSVPGMWVAGDVNGKMMLAHKAYREASVAVSDMFGEDEKMRYDSVMSVVYSSPEFASVGVSAESASVRAFTVPASYSPRYVAESADRDGFIKFMIDTEKGVLRGAHLALPYASEIVGALAAFIHLGTPVKQIKKLCFPHPSVSELISYIPYPD